MTIRENLLAEYKKDDFKATEKLKKTDDGNGKYLPLKEKIKMFRADYPDGEINVDVLTDNNIFAAVKVTVKCSCGSASAVGKWYHSNNDSYGMNYLSSAQSIALSNALKFLGYDDSVEEIEPPAELNKGPLDFLDEEESQEIKPPIGQPFSQKQKLNIVEKKQKVITYEEALSMKLSQSPFVGMTVADALKTENVDALIDMLKFYYNQGTSYAPYAKVVLEKMGELSG